MKVWFLLPESLSGWVKSQLSLVNHLGSFLGIGETFYLWLNFPPVLTWHGIYSYIESVITITSEIPHSLELHYYGTFVRLPIAVSAPNWFIWASVRTKWSEGGGEPGTTLDYPVAEFPVDRRDFQTELNTRHHGCLFALLLCSTFKITYINKASINFTLWKVEWAYPLSAMLLLNRKKHLALKGRIHFPLGRGGWIKKPRNTFKMFSSDSLHLQNRVVSFNSSLLHLDSTPPGLET